MKSACSDLHNKVMNKACRFHGNGSKNSNTQEFCGLYFSHASNLNFIEQTLAFIDRP